MYELKVLGDFSAAHQLNFFKTGCERLHGHNWKVELCVQGNELDENGLLMDFKELKRILNEVLDYLDHRFLNDLEPFKDMSPSSENVARWIFQEVSKKIEKAGIFVSRVTVWESDTACASCVGQGMI